VTLPRRPSAKGQGSREGHHTCCGHASSRSYSSVLSSAPCHPTEVAASQAARNKHKRQMFKLNHLHLHLF